MNEFYSWGHTHGKRAAGGGAAAHELKIRGQDANMGFHTILQNNQEYHEKYPKLRARIL
jgi:hypothetical protein